MKKKKSMRSIWLHLVLGSMFLVPLGLPGQAQAETITLADRAAYDAYVVAAGSNDVVPASSSSGNTITIGVAGVTGPTINGYVVGGDSRKGDPTAANNNTVTVTGSTAEGVIGGYVYIRGDYSATASGNTVNIAQSTVDHRVYNNVYVDGDGSATVSNNKINVSQGSKILSGIGLTANVGGNGTATLSGNTIAVTDSTIGGTSNGRRMASSAGISAMASVYGDGTATASDNTITISNSTLDGSSQMPTMRYISNMGGSISVASYVSGDGTATVNGNTITLTDSTISGGSTPVYTKGSGSNSNGGIAFAATVNGKGSATVSGNTISLSNSQVGSKNNQVQLRIPSTTVSDITYQAKVDDGDATISGNTVALTENTLVLGSITSKAVTVTSGNAAVTGNKITMQDSQVKKKILNKAVTRGTGDATVSDNTVDLQNSKVKKILNKAIARGDGNATVNGNTITLQNSTVKSYVYNEAFADGDGNATVSGNTITLQDSTVKSDIENESNAHGNGDAVTSGNSIILKNSTVKDDIINDANAYGDGNATVSGNTISLQDCTVKDEIYNDADVYGDGNATISGNVIILNNSTVRYGVSNAAAVDGAGNATISGNVITLNNSTVKYNVSNDAIARTSGSAEIIGNTINIIDSTVKNDIYLGWAVGPDTATKIVQDNTLNIKGTVDLADANLYGGVKATYDSNYNYTKTMGKNNTLNMYSKDVTALSVSYFNNYNFYLPAGVNAGDSILTLTDGATDLTGSVTDVKTVADDFSLQVGDKVNLFSNANGVTVDPAQPTEVTAEKNVALDYDMVLDHDANNLYATIKDIHANERTKSFLEGRLGASMFVNKGADIIGDNDILGKLRKNKTYEGIAILDYGKEKATTGSSVEVKGLSMLLGFGKAVDSGKGTLRWAPFIEAGWGSYEAENEFLNYADVNGKGDTDYYGVGFMARQTGASGNYIEGSVRAGRLGDDYNSDLSYNGKSADYDITTTYYGAHVGIGKLMVHEKYDLDVFAKYFYNKVKGDDVTIFATDYNFDDTTSNRLKAGFKYTGKLSKNNTWFGGAAWEYEMSGSQRGTVSGYDIAAPDYKGSTGVVTAGYSYTPDDKKYDVDFSLSERFGKRHGLSARVNCRFKI